MKEKIKPVLVCSFLSTNCADKFLKCHFLWTDEDLHELTRKLYLKQLRLIIFCVSSSKLMSVA